MKSLKSIFDKSKYILSEEGLWVFLDRLIRISCVRTKRPFLNNEPIIDKWLTLKDRYKGERAFLIGNGPSLNRTPMHLLKNEFTMCFNRFNIMFERLDWIPNFYCNIDDRVLLDMVEEISTLSNIFQYLFVPDVHPYNINFKKKIRNADNICWLFLDRLPFSQNLPYCGINKTVASVGLQVLAYLGFNPIYLIGMDLDYQDHTSAKKDSSRDWTSTADDDPNHFDPRYFGMGRKYHHPRLEETFKRLEEGKKFFDSLNVNIYNATVGGKLEVFERKEFRLLFKQDPLEEFGMFKDAIRNSTNGEIGLDFTANDYESFLSKKQYHSLEEIDDFNKYNIDFFSLDIENALNVLSECIFSFVPFGPFKDKYLFVNRKSIINR